MASRGLSLLRLRPTTFISTGARPPRLPSSVIRPLPTPPTRPPPLPSLRRSLSRSLPRARQRDPRQQGPPDYDYDPLLGDPWYYYRLRKAKPLFGGRTARQFLRSPRTRTVVVASAALALLFYWWNLEVVPVSGRRRFNCYSEKTVRELSEVQHRRLLSEMERTGRRFLHPDDRRARMVRRVMARLVPVAAAGAPEGEEDPDAGAWEVRVIDDDDLRNANAFVLPGGKVFVFSGLLRLAQTEDQLAVVLSHEIAHNLAKHIGERLSQSIGETFFLGSGLMLVAATPFAFVAGWLFGGSLLNVLFSRPMGRMQESEADFIGLMMMAEACYDPRQAVTFWERMEYLYQQLGVEPPEFLSTHPSNQHRIENITGWLPKAMEKRETSDCRGTQGFAEMFRRAMERGDVLVSRM